MQAKQSQLSEPCNIQHLAAGVSRILGTYRGIDLALTLSAVSGTLARPAGTIVDVASLIGAQGWLSGSGLSPARLAAKAPSGWWLLPLLPSDLLLLRLCSLNLLAAASQLLQPPSACICLASSSRHRNFCSASIFQPPRVLVSSIPPTSYSSHSAAPRRLSLSSTRPVPTYNLSPPSTATF